VTGHEKTRITNCRVHERVSNPSFLGELLVASGVPANTIRHADLNYARAACQQVAFKKAIASLLATLRHMSPHGIYQHRIFTQ
jgi:hypothetical protein